jgi:hypothetical protein
MSGGAAGPDAGTLASLLGRCLSLRPDDREAGALRSDLRAHWDRFLGWCDDLRLTPAVAERILRRNLAPPGAEPALAASVAANIRRRKAMAGRLDELVLAFNRAGIEPILIKGAISLMAGGPGWRTLRDIDLVVPPPDTERAQAVAEGIGYRVSPTAGKRGARSRHHMPELFRDDLPGWIEIHAHAGNYNAEPFLPVGELAGSSAPAAMPGGGRVRIPPPHLAVLHALIHHHVGHSADRHGRLDLKGLYEFAAGVLDLAPVEREALVARAGRHPRLVAALDLWIAAAADFYALPVEPPFVFEPLALARWRTIRARAESPEPPPAYPGYREEIVLAFRAIARNESSGVIGRTVGRLRVIRSLLPKLY